MWTVARGTYRLVIAIPTLSVVIKLPRATLRRSGVEKKVVLWRWVKNFFHELRLSMRQCLQDRSAVFKYSTWHWVLYTAGRFWEIAKQERIFWAIADNWRERRYYKHTDSVRKSILKPTYFSLLGICNIQQLGHPSTVCYRVVKHAFWKLTEWDSNVEGHHLENPGNFDDFSLGLKFLDYGGKGVQKFIEKHGLLLAEKFDIEAGRYYDKPRDLR